MKKALEQAHSQEGILVSEVVCGEARGVDLMGKKAAQAKNIPVKSFPADWSKHGKAAGPIRNRKMAEYADALIAIWDGKSRGTKNMIETAEKLDLTVYVLRLENELDS